MSCWVIISINVTQFILIITTHLRNLRGICFRMELILSELSEGRLFSHINTVRLGQGDHFKLANADDIVVRRLIKGMCLSFDCDCGK